MPDFSYLPSRISSIQDADLSEPEKRRLQTVAERMLAQWTSHKEYPPPPGMGSLTTLDSALIVKPPPGFEVGYVLIVIKQSPR